MGKEAITLDSTNIKNIMGLYHEYDKEHYEELYTFDLGKFQDKQTQKGQKTLNSPIAIKDIESIIPGPDQSQHLGKK